MECGQRAASLVVLVTPRGCMCASSTFRALPLPTCGERGRLCAQSLPAFSRWLVCGWSLGIEPRVLFIASCFHLLGCVTLLFGRGHQPSLSAAVTPSCKGWLARMAGKAFPLSCPSWPLHFRPPDSSHLDLFLSSCPWSASANLARGWQTGHSPGSELSRSYKGNDSRSW